MISKKRGIAPIISTVLLIALAIALVGLIFVWAKGFIGKSSEQGKNVLSVSCENVAFEADMEGSGIKIINEGNMNISITIKKIAAGEESICEPEENGERVIITSQETKIIPDICSLSGNLDVIPVIVEKSADGENEFYLCDERFGKVLK